MPRKVRRKTSWKTPAESLLRRLSNTDEAIRRRVLTVSLWVVCSLFAYSLMSGTYGIPSMISLRLEKDGLVESNRRLTVELVDAVRTRQMLLSDGAYLEMIARTRFHMARKNETIFRYRGR